MNFKWRTFKKSMGKLKWNKVTWYSKLSALVFFIAAVPVITFILGVEYQKTITSMDDSWIRSLSLNDNYVRVSHDASSEEVLVTIYKPADLNEYAKKIADFEAGKFGDRNVIEIINENDLVIEQVKIKLASSSFDVIRETANASAVQMGSEGKPLEITNFLIENSTAYVKLNIDTDLGPNAILIKNYAYPIIRKTLLQFPAIKRVIFGPAKFQI